MLAVLCEMSALDKQKMKFFLARKKLYSSRLLAESEFLLNKDSYRKADI
jgi:hypothetical protein